jgi:hypothetical protein
MRRRRKRKRRRRSKRMRRNTKRNIKKNAIYKDKNNTGWKEIEDLKKKEGVGGRRRGWWCRFFNTKSSCIPFTGLDWDFSV